MVKIIFAKHTVSSSTPSAIKMIGNYLYVISWECEYPNVFFYLLIRFVIWYWNYHIRNQILTHLSERYQIRIYYYERCFIMFCGCKLSFSKVKGYKLRKFLKPNKGIWCIKMFQKFSNLVSIAALLIHPYFNVSAINKRWRMEKSYMWYYVTLVIAQILWLYHIDVTA